MKNLPIVWFLSLALVAGCSSTGNRGGGTAQVEFINPEKFTDIKSRDIPVERMRELLFPDLERYIQKQARIYIPAGREVTIRITDIDDAGWVNPVGVSHHRAVRQYQPGRVDFEYVLRDSSGKTLSEGKETLSDLPWDRTDRMYENEQLPLIKQMLRNWIRKIGRTV